MSAIFRRSLTTISHAGPSTPIPALPSITRTVPQAVKRRREEALLRANPDLKPKDLPAPPMRGPKLLSPRHEAQFQALRAQGQFKGDEASGRKAFWEKQVKWRSRIRGYAGGGGPSAMTAEASEEGVGADGSSELANGKSSTESETSRPEVVGQRIYLPNIQIRLMRNHTPPGEAYDPYIATFRIPHSMTKNDLRSYLSAVYNLPVTFIRTDNYFASTKRFPGGQLRVQVGSQKNYKRAVVGLVEPFHYPDDVEEMYAQGAENGMGTEMGDKRKEWLDDNFQIEQMKDYKKKALMKFYKTNRWRNKTHDNAGNAVRQIMKKRLEKEENLRQEVVKMRAEVSSGASAEATTA